MSVRVEAQRGRWRVSARVRPRRRQAAALAAATVLAGSLALVGESSADDPTNEGIGIPARAIDLPEDHYVFVGGLDHGLNQGRDMKVTRAKSGGGWSGVTENGAQNAFCSANKKLVGCDLYGTGLAYGLPIHAPVDGVVVGCWRNHPTNPGANMPIRWRCCGGLLDNSGKCFFRQSDGKNMDCGHEDCPAAIASCSAAICQDAVEGCRVNAAGNHIHLVTEDMYKVLFAHLAPKSIPKRLCPKKKKLMKNALDTPCDECPIPTEAVIPPDKWPVVRRGDFLGRLGSTGAASGPHTHVGLQAVTVTEDGDFVDDHTMAYRVKNAWVRPRTKPNAWTKLDGDIMPETGSGLIMHASPFLRRGDADGAGVQRIAVADSGVTVARGPDDRLVLRSWGVSAAGSITQQDAFETQGKALEVAVARPGPDRDVVTAVKAANGKLKLIYWNVGAGGAIKAGHDNDKGGALGNVVALTEYPEDRGVISAVAARNGDLKLTAWKVRNNGRIVRRGSASGGPIRLVDVATVRNGRLADETDAEPFQGVVTAAKSNANTLRVQSWSFDAAAGTLAKAGGVNLGPVSGHIAVAAVPVEGGRELVVVAARDGDGMRLVSLAVDSQGALVERWDTRLGDAREITLAAVSTGRFLTALQDASGKLRLIGWWLGPAGKLIRLGDEQAGTVGLVATAVLSRSGGETLLALAAVQAANEKLKLISFDTNL